MISKLANWFLNQISLAGPFSYAVEKGWIPPEAANWISSTFFAPFNLAADNSETLEKMRSQMIEAWQQFPF